MHGNIEVTRNGTCWPESDKDHKTFMNGNSDHVISRSLVWRTGHVPPRLHMYSRLLIPLHSRTLLMISWLDRKKNLTTSIILYHRWSSVPCIFTAPMHDIHFFHGECLIDITLTLICLEIIPEWAQSGWSLNMPTFAFPELYRILTLYCFFFFKHMLAEMTTVFYRQGL